MIENNNPEINVDEIMQKIREEIANRSNDDYIKLPSQSFTISNHLMSTVDFQRITENLAIAEQNAEVGTKLLPMQRYPKLIRWIATLTGRIILYLTEIISFPQRIFNQSMLQALRDATENVRDLDKGLLDLKQNMQEQTNKIEEQTNKIEEQTNKMTEFEERIARAWLAEQAAEQTKKIEGLAEREALIATGLAERDKQITDLKKTVSYLKTNLVYQERRLGILLEEARKRLPELLDQEQLETFSNEEASLLDPHYLFFEDQFRGTQQEIKDRLRVYIPLLKACQAGTIDPQILDVGCGRGEWLELLKEEKIVAQGIDINRVLVQENLDRGFDVIQGDAIEYLRSLPDGSIGGITAFHLVEHLPFRTLLKFMNESLRVLISGGIAIFETPNPENILVGTTNFYVDPTHRNPLPASMMKFLTESRGFCKVDIKRLHPYGEEFRLDDSNSELAERFNDYFYGPQDYAIIGYKV